MKNLYGVVILYNPSKEIIKNIQSYLNCLKKLYIMDNSEKMDTFIVSQLKSMSEKIEYVSLNGNYGIAYPINRVIKTLSNEDWLLTMDQDSYFYKDTFSKYIQQINTLNKDVYAICPKIMLEEPKNNINFSGLKLKEDCIQSGAIYNVQILKTVGMFDEKLFIDCIDTEICYRCNGLGYKLYANDSVILIHHLGNKITNFRAKIFPFKITLVQHNALRRYYIVRNNLYLMNKYPNKKRKILLYLIKDFIKIILFNDFPISKLKMAIRGYKDYKNKIYGKFHVNKN